MRTPLLLYWLLFPVLLIQAQYNLPLSLEDDYCHRMRSAEKQLKLYQNPVPVNPLLQDYDVKFYFLDLSVENNTIDITGKVTVKAEVTAWTLDTFAFELTSGMAIDSLLVDGVKHAFQRTGDLVMVPLATGLDLGSMITVKTVYHGTPPSGGFFSGVTTDYDEGYDKNVTWSLSEPYAAKDWWPTKQDLNDKIDSVWVFLTTSEGNMAGSQGLLTGVTSMPGGTVRYEWKSYYPIAYYLISFAVADYMEYNIYAHPVGLEDSVLIQNFIYNDPACLAANQVDIDRTADFIELFSELFGMYPFSEEKYGHCLTELGGGMEHQTMTTLGGFNFGLVAHELGHMWFGDDVTCATWNDIWINEGFATYSDYLAHSFLADPIYDSIWLRIRHNHVKGQPGGSVYVPDEDLGNISRIFDGRLSYSKGALLLHMIRFELNDDDLFFDILRSYVEEFGDSTATGADFRDWVEMGSGMDFTDFFNQWYYGEGYPIFDIAWSQSDGKLHITSTQSASTAVTPLFRMTVPYIVTFADGTDTTLRLFQGANLETYTVPVSRQISRIEVDPDQWILHKLNSLVMGLEDPENPVFFTVGPNPATDFMVIRMNKRLKENIVLTISDMAGKMVMKEEIHGMEERINLGSLKAGIYIVSLDSEGNRLNRKLIIQ
jgi:aminopeptidase N